ncbi:transcription-silencing protein clr2 domain-containing protein [Purpureocillium lavendulum]|uniref:Transcription-silencing protein clr2 domain-containing protein n=1 Tax=Purpureocillium lavendulum TaxID=1247861 RepID=A0AB34FFB1_9HYPO|nr:transcription-silencing protein clr2 domain-containing protein [Purpureocillium lavendulum]
MQPFLTGNQGQGSLSVSSKRVATALYPETAKKASIYKIPFNVWHGHICRLQERYLDERYAPIGKKLRILKQACEDHDSMFILLHGLFCIWSLNKPLAHQLCSVDPSSMDHAFDLLALLIGYNNESTLAAVRSFSPFPSDVSVSTADVGYSEHSRQLASTITHLEMVYDHTLSESAGLGRTRRLMDHLRSPSPLVQTLLTEYLRDEENKIRSMDRLLPQDVLLRVAYFLSPQDCLNFVLVSRRLGRKVGYEEPCRRRARTMVNEENRLSTNPQYILRPPVFWDLKDLKIESLCRPIGMELCNLIIRAFNDENEGAHLQHFETLLRYGATPGATIIIPEEEFVWPKIEVSCSHSTEDSQYLSQCGLLRRARRVDCQSTEDIPDVFVTMQPLQLAVYLGMSGFVKALVNHGADRASTMIHGFHGLPAKSMAPVDIAHLQRFSGIASILIPPNRNDRSSGMSDAPLLGGPALEGRPFNQHDNYLHPDIAWTLRESLHFRSGELIWYQRRLLDSVGELTHDWRLGLVVEATPGEVEVIPLDHKLRNKSNRRIPVKYVRPFHVFSNPPVAHCDEPWIVGEGNSAMARQSALEYTKKIANTIAGSHSLLGPSSTDPYTGDTSYPGCFLGPERIGLGDCLRVLSATRHEEDDTVLALRTISCQNDNEGLTFVGDIFVRMDQIAPNPKALPIPLQDEVNWHRGSSYRQSHWHLRTKNVHLPEEVIAGRFYPKRFRENIPNGLNHRELKSTRLFNRLGAIDPRAWGGRRVGPQLRVKGHWSV